MYGCQFCTDLIGSGSRSKLLEHAERLRVECAALVGLRANGGQFGFLAECARELPTHAHSLEGLGRGPQLRGGRLIGAGQSVGNGACPLRDGQVQAVAIAQGQFAHVRQVLGERGRIALLDRGIGEQRIGVVLMSDRAAPHRLTGRPQTGLKLLPQQGELALRPKGQRPSVKLIALPALGLAGHGEHVVVRRLPVGVRLLQVATQRVDARAERDEESGFAYALAWELAFERAPALFRGQHVVPAIEAEQTLRL